MIPISLSIEGLYSYQQKQDINFEYLTDAQLFGIFGSTGSGKSSILEAITFALYGQSDRLNQRDNRGYNMMNLRSDRLFISFDFKVQENQYRFVVNGRRNSKNYEEVRTIERKAFEMKGGELIPMESADGEKVIGLSYDNFRRTIIIPQGKFQEFLQLGEAERTRMLKEIFHLQRFELDYKVKSLQGKNNRALDLAQERLAELASINREGLDALEAEIAAKNQLVQDQEQQIQQLEKTFAAQDKVRQLFVQISEQTKLVQELENRNDEIENKEQQLQHYETCLITFKPALDRRKETLQENEQLKQQLDAQHKALVQSEEDLARGERTFADIEEQFQQRDQFLVEAEEIEAVVELKKLKEIADSKQIRIQNGKQKVEELRQEMENSRAEIQQNREKMRTIRENNPDVLDVMAVQEWFAKKKQLRGELDQLKAQLNEIQTEQRQLDQRKTALLQESALDARQYDLPLEPILNLLREEETKAVAESEKLNQEIQHLAVQAQLKQFSENLQEGEPCPICGSVHHPDRPEYENIAYNQQKLSRQLEDFQKQARQLQSQIAQLEALRPQFAQGEDRLARQNKLLGEKEGEYAALQASFIWPQFNKNDDASLQLHLDKIKETQAELKKREGTQLSLENTFEDQEKTIRKYQSVLEQLQKEREEAEVNFQGKRKSLKKILFEAYQSEDDLHLRRKADQLRAQHKEIEGTFKTYQDRIQRSRENAAKLKGSIQELKKRSADLTARLAQLNQELDAFLESSAFSSLTEVENILAQSWNVEATKTEIRNFRQQLHSATEKLQDLKAEAADKNFDEAGFQQLESQIAEQKAKLAEAQIQLGSLQNDQKRMTADLARKNELQKEQDQLTVRKEDLRTLHNLFRASGFVNYVSTIYLQNLCKAANERFMRLTKGVLRLEKARNSNSFEVVDQLNGGRRRSVKTLSGGQTFQASLCLALALADQVRQQAKEKENFFFLDEGFGSQDKDSLRIIFETLKSLRQEDRIVGVISHVEELQQEIGAYLHIHNDPETGSKVVGSWE